MRASRPGLKGGFSVPGFFGGLVRFASGTPSGCAAIKQQTRVNWGKPRAEWREVKDGLEWFFVPKGQEDSAQGFNPGWSLAVK